MTQNTRSTDDATDRRRTVRDRYATIANTESDDGCCGAPDADTSAPIASSGPDEREPDARSRELGYESDDVDDAPDGANLGLGCGNPVAIANLEAGETVLDLGSGGGFDCFLAAREVGSEGRAIGVDMTPEMVERARENARESEFENVEFRLGEIEHLPVADGSVDAIVSNCVINLSPAKSQVYAEAARALRPGGRLSVSDLVATEPLPSDLVEDADLLAGCIGGAATADEHRIWLDEAGFTDVEIVDEGEWAAEHDGESLPIVSARIEASLPG